VRQGSKSGDDIFSFHGSGSRPTLASRGLTGMS